MRSKEWAVLNNAIALISGGWTKGRQAANARGMRVPVYSSKASMFCMVGALNRSCNDTVTDYRERRDIRARVRILVMKSLPGWESIPHFNDYCHTQKADVLAALRRALEMA